MADLTHDTADDAFHEIHLSGKQLVFLFMATTVISVIIFICGVLVGRRVAAQEIARTERPPVVTDAAPADTPPATSEAPVPVSEAPSPDYQGRLEGRNPPRTEPLRPLPEEPPAPTPSQPQQPHASQPQPVSETPAPAAPVRTDPQPEPKPEPPVRAEIGTAGARPGVWAVQVVSLRDRAAAMQLVQRLKGKGYPAYMVAPVAGAPSQLYKVQVGRYKDRIEAQQVDTKLKKEEQFKTWIVR